MRPDALVAVASVWALFQRAMTWRRFFVSLALVAAAATGLFSLQGGFGVGEMLTASAVTAAGAGLGALVAPGPRAQLTSP